MPWADRNGLNKSSADKWLALCFRITIVKRLDLYPDGCQLANLALQNADIAAGVRSSPEFVAVFSSFIISASVFSKRIRFGL
jgi:hypothetical protein